MATRREPVRYAVYQIGALQYSSEVRNATTLANQTQHAFYFDFQDRRFSLAKQHRLANGGYDLNSAISVLLQRYRIPRPVVFITSEPYTDLSSQHETDLNKGFFFSEFCVEKGVAAVSTHLWQGLPGDRRVQPYVLFTLASVAFDFCAELSIHDETRGCPFDYCDLPIDIDKALLAPGLCPECSRLLDRALRTGKATLDQSAAAERLLNRAAGRKQAFVAMPFRPDLETVFMAVRKLLEKHNWKVVRADEVSYPRSITDAIIYSILASDLVIADVTGSNPNVFYELGWAHAVEQDVLLLTQEREIPFDVTTERAIKYTPDQRGVAQLVRGVSRAVGI
ncbi:MAG: hypothetical protein NTX87_14435 [Planctomycetota bacterium]|nr:hypothetical protein [Planctomycetota bacterium]